MNETWLLDELAHAGPEHLDAEFIAGYDRKQGYPDADGDIAAFAAHGLDGASTVVDLGTGTGQFAVPALRRVADMLRPGGVLRLRDLIYDFAPGETDAVFDGWFAGAAADPSAGYTAADYAEHIRTEYSTFRWLFEPMLTAAGFEIADISYQGRLYGTYTCIKAGT